MVDVEVVGFPADGGPSAGQFHSAELGAVIAAANGYGVYASTITATITGASRVITFPAFTAFVPDGAGAGVSVSFAGGTATPSAGGADPRTDIIVLEDDGSLTVVAGVATALSSSVVEPPMPAVPSNAILLMKVPLAAGQGSFTAADQLHGRAIDVTNHAPADDALVGSNSTEQTTTSTGDLVTVSGLSIPTTSIITVEFDYRKAATASIIQFGVQLNTTELFSSGVGPATGATNEAQSGHATVVCGPRDDSNYLRGVTGYYGGSGATAQFNAALRGVNAMPSAVVTQVIIACLANAGGVTAGVKNVRVYEKPV